MDHEIFKNVCVKHHEKSRIVVNAKRILSGRLPEFCSVASDDSDFFFIEQNDLEKIIDIVLELFTKRIPNRFALYPGRDIKVLTFSKIGKLGDIEIKRNMIINSIEEEGVLFIEDWQRSGYEAVIIPIHAKDSEFLCREVLYTSIILARKLVVIVGMRDAVEISVSRSLNDVNYYVRNKIYSLFDNSYPSNRSGSSYFPSRSKGVFNTIETYYDGYKFRSRLEARWAVFLNALDIRYEYEPEGFYLGDSIKYLPDFYLPEQDTFLEIKPTSYGYRDYEDLAETRTFQKCLALAEATGAWVYFISGNPYFEEYSVTAIMPGSDNYIRRGQFALLPIEEENRTEEPELDEKNRSFFSRLLFGEKRDKTRYAKNYKYILYPTEPGIVYIQTKEKQERAYRMARMKRFY